MTRALALVLISCSNTEAPPPKVASAPIHETAPIPTSTEAAPQDTTAPAPSPAPLSTAPASSSGKAPPASSSAPKTGALSAAECDKVIHKFAELVAQDQNATLLEGFQSSPIYVGMRDLCVKQTTRTQYDCAMSAKTMQKWQECMK